jgi:hypothetical protein
MTVNFNRQAQPAPVVANKVAMPVGTSIILSMDKFLFEKRDSNCRDCRNGYRSTLPKMLDGKMYSVSVICTCVPYYQNTDAEGSGVVSYKGRRENWVKGVRPEAEIQAELIREGKANADFSQKINPKAPLQNKDGKNTKANLEKALQNDAKPAQKFMQQDQQGHWLFVDLETGKKMGLRVSDVANPAINPDNPDKAVKPEPAQPQVQPEQQASGYKGLRPESDEEFLQRTTGEVPMEADPRVISEAEATKIEASRITPVAPVTAPKAIPPQAPKPPEVKRGRGRPKGPAKK